MQNRFSKLSLLLVIGLVFHLKEASACPAFTDTRPNIPDKSLVMILGNPDDQTKALEREFLQRRVSYFYFNTALVGSGGIRITNEPQTGSWRLKFPQGKVIHSSQIYSVYWRNYMGVRIPAMSNSSEYNTAYHNTNSLVEAMLKSLDAKWVNHWDAFKLHQTKPVQLAAIANQGIPTPRTIVTNDLDEIRAFVGSGESSIVKPAQGGWHTRRLGAGILEDPEFHRSLESLPVTVQERIDGTDIRVFVAGEFVAGISILTSADDFREDPNAVYQPLDLPEPIIERSRVIAQTLGLTWTGIDYRLQENGEYIYLEANASPMFVGFERLTGVPLTSVLADLLAP